MRTCRWVLQPYAPGKEALYCGKPVRFRMTEDGGEHGASKVRKYETFCDAHKRAAEAMDEDMGDE